MPEAKLVVIYSRPTKHVPMAVAKLARKTKIVAKKITSSPQGTPPFHRMAEIHFPSKAAPEACAHTLGAQETLANAAKISSGGAPLFLIAEKRYSRSVMPSTLVGRRLNLGFALSAEYHRPARSCL